jgi:hypothetical protein
MPCPYANMRGLQPRISEANIAGARRDRNVPSIQDFIFES